MGRGYCKASCYRSDNAEMERHGGCGTYGKGLGILIATSEHLYLSVGLVRFIKGTRLPNIPKLPELWGASFRSHANLPLVFLSAKYSRGDTGRGSIFSLNATEANPFHGRTRSFMMVQLRVQSQVAFSQLLIPGKNPHRITSNVSPSLQMRYVIGLG
jgi:hypothetical protein